MANTWRNWLGNQSAQPARIEEPDDVAGVVAAIERAAARGWSVRAVSGAYCWSPLVPCEDMILSLARLKRVRHVDRENCRITIEAGAPLRDLVLVALEHGMSVQSPSMFMGLTVAGLIATGSHGTGRDTATFGDYVVGYELVTARGEVVTASDVGSPRWRALITNLGALGVLTAVTLQLVPLYNVMEVHETVHYAESAARIPAMLAAHEFVSVFWSPAGSIANFKMGDRTTAPAARVAGRMFPTWLDRANELAGRVLPRVLERVPVLTEFMASQVSERIGTGNQVVREPEFSHYQQVYPPVLSAEFAVPLELAPDAWGWMVTRLMEYWRSGMRPVDMVVHARFGKASRSLLASSGGRATCHLEVLTVDGNRQREVFVREMDEKMRRDFHGRPHWGKDLVRPWTLAETYGPALEEFLQIRAEMDPAQRFLNPFLRDEVFGLGRRLRGAP